MPYVNIRITKEKNVTPEKKRQLIEGATNLLHDVLGKQNKQLIRLVMVYAFLAILIHALGIEFGVVPIVIGFLFAVLALCKIVYNF